ncbi:MAG: NifU family protein [Holosporaceae bacterium]|jgi:Fe-S cluster biogenesis protein NfuA|nr:NifU family protein [Holosporaceae bacterium]
MNYDPKLWNDILDVIEKAIRPSLVADGGDISVVSLENSILYVKLSGACAHCPCAAETLKNGVENTLRRLVSPELVVLAV